VSCLLEIELPFTWTLLNSENLPEDFPMNKIVYALLDHSDGRFSESGAEMESDLYRIEHKVDLILQMLGQMMQSGVTLPLTENLQLAADEIAWYYPDAKMDENYQVSIYLNNNNCLPLNMRVRVIGIEAGWCHVRILHSNINEQSIWERWVFRQHRRHVAFAREQVKT